MSLLLTAPVVVIDMVVTVSVVDCIVVVDIVDVVSGSVGIGRLQHSSYAVILNSKLILNWVNINEKFQNNRNKMPFLGRSKLDPAE